MKTKMQKIIAEMKNRHKKHTVLLRNIKKKLPILEAVLAKVNSHWVYEDHVYRYYHTSFKVYDVQVITLAIVKTLISISPHKDKSCLNENFLEIINSGTGHKFELSHNGEWNKRGRPMIEAFFHAKYFLEMAVKYGKEFKKLRKAPNIIPSGWACLLYLYNIR